MKISKLSILSVVAGAGVAVVAFQMQRPSPPKSEASMEQPSEPVVVKAGDTSEGSISHSSASPFDQLNKIRETHLTGALNKKQKKVAKKLQWKKPTQMDEVVTTSILLAHETDGTVSPEMPKMFEKIMSQNPTMAFDSISRTVNSLQGEEYSFDRAALLVAAAKLPVDAEKRLDLAKRELERADIRARTITTVKDTMPVEMGSTKEAVSAIVAHQILMQGLDDAAKAQALTISAILATKNTEYRQILADQFMLKFTGSATGFLDSLKHQGITLKNI